MLALHNQGNKQHGSWELGALCTLDGPLTPVRSLEPPAGSSEQPGCGGKPASSGLLPGTVGLG